MPLMSSTKSNFSNPLQPVCYRAKQRYHTIAAIRPQITMQTITAQRPFSLTFYDYKQV